MIYEDVKQIIDNTLDEGETVFFLAEHDGNYYFQTAYDDDFTEDGILFRPIGGGYMLGDGMKLPIGLPPEDLSAEDALEKGVRII